jgi:hypothetical protein
MLMVKQKCYSRMPRKGKKISAEAATLLKRKSLSLQKF